MPGFRNPKISRRGFGIISGGESFWDKCQYITLLV
jgi:hypothetical protein